MKHSQFSIILSAFFVLIAVSPTQAESRWKFPQIFPWQTQSQDTLHSPDDVGRAPWQSAAADANGANPNTPEGNQVGFDQQFSVTTSMQRITDDTRSFFARTHENAQQMITDTAGSVRGFFGRTRDTFMPWTREPPAQPIGGLQRSWSGASQSSGNFITNFFRREPEQPQQLKTISDWMALPKPDY